MTFWSACPASAIFNVPEDSVTVMPAGGLAVQVTVSPAPTAWTRRVASVEPPGSTAAVPGWSADRNGRAPVPKDGGASFGSLPNVVFGCAGITRRNGPWSARPVRARRAPWPRRVLRPL